MQPKVNGKVLNEPAEAYHSRKERSRGQLWDFIESKRLFEARHILGTVPQKKPSKPMDIGTLGHGALLEPERIDDMYVVIPDGLLSGENRAIQSKEAKAWRDEHLAAGKIVIKDTDLPKIKAIAANVLKECEVFLRGASFIEKTIIWTDPETGIECRCRPDIMRFTNRNTIIMVDAKFTTDISPHAFRGKIESLGYWLQDAHYSDGGHIAIGMPVEQFLFVAVQSEPPYQCRAYQLDDDSREGAVLTRKNAMNDLAECMRTGNFAEPWEGQVTKVSVRGFAFSQEG